MKDIILASQSPRRKELLALMGVEYDVVPSSFDEQLDDSRTPQEVAAELAFGKAHEVAERYPNSLVIGSDTIVTIDGVQLGKPADATEAYDMLKRLSGTFHDVTTAVAIVRKSDDTQLVDADTTKVFFKPFDEDAVTKYIQTGDSLDKAGGYGIQSGAAELMTHIEGYYDTVVGFPTHLAASLLEQVGVSAHPVTLEPPLKQVLK